ncbi:MAG: TonB-dependent receptor [Crocinitomicaceae bacterium]|nr:TonB-dependent receptor [Crocinitomicaceae bacterium]
MRYLLIALLLLPAFSNAQVKGKITDSVSAEGVFGVKIQSSEGQRSITETDGSFQIRIDAYPVKLYLQSIEHKPDTIQLDSETSFITIALPPLFQEVGTVVVSASKRDEKIEEVSISMEVLKPELIEAKGFVNLEQAVDQSPGVYAMDGQVSIRGGGGYSYGVGSRVLVLTNGIPLISPDLGDAKWNSISMESMSQIEITKGASSVLYGSSALNGTISVTSKEPTKEGEFSAKIQSGIFDNPKRETLKWWSKNPANLDLSVYNGKMFDTWGYTVAVNGFKTEGYKEGEQEQRTRLTGSFVFRPKKTPRLKINLDYSGQAEWVHSFIIWESAEFAYTPSGGLSSNPSDNTLTFQKSVRLNVDPSIKYVDQNNGIHQLKTRYYLVTIGGGSSFYEASLAQMYYADYSYQKTWNNAHHLTTGLTNSYNSVVSDVFGNHTSKNFATYAQYDFKKKRFGFTAGIRTEYFQMDDRAPDSEFTIGKNGNSIPVYPILRAAAHYKATKSTFLRASIGQGIRFPSVSERYSNTSNGAIYIFPNPELTPERGWSAEVGAKQVVKMGKWKGILDVAAFVNHYDDMIEFTFGIYNPDSIALNLDPNSPGYLYKWIGFKAKNAEEAQITGLEFSFSSEGKIKEVELRSLIGYTYMNPVSLNSDPDYLLTFSDTVSGMLKYRFNHLARVDIEAGYKNFKLGFSSRYNSFMKNIDQIFEENIVGTEILPGLQEYRANDQSGSLVFDSRISYELKEQYTFAFIVNNLLNTEYSSRPADVQPPRQFMVQVRYNL